MPMNVIGADGDEMQVPTPEEFAALQEQVKTVEELQKKVDEMSQDINPNWQQARQRMRMLEDKLAKAGLPEGDQQPPTQPAMSVEQIQQTVAQTTRSELLNQHKNQLLQRFDPETRKVVDVYYSKLVAGEEVSNTEQVEKFINDAARIVSPTQYNSVIVSGQPPRYDDKQPDFSQTDAGKSVAANMGLKIGKVK